MGKSVKLTDGSYIDAEGVWDNALGKSLADINAVETYEDTTNGLYYTKVGRLVMLSVQLNQATYAANSETAIATLHYTPLPRTSAPNLRFYDVYSNAKLIVTIKTDIGKVVINNNTTSAVTDNVRCVLFYFSAD